MIRKGSIVKVIKGVNKGLVGEVRSTYSYHNERMAAVHFELFDGPWRKDFPISDLQKFAPTRQTR